VELNLERIGVAQCNVWLERSVSCAKMAEFDRATMCDREWGGPKELYIRWCAHWCLLANMVE